MTDHSARMLAARRSLDGLSVGDAFGDRFFGTPGVIDRMIELRALPADPWPVTDDTVMALSVVEVLETHHGIDRDELAARFAARHHADPDRGYGDTARTILRALSDGEDWRHASRQAFGGEGSMGNGGAMRAPPIGAYFFDAFERAAEEARRSAEVTHAHPEAQAGAAAVAVAAAWMGRGGGAAEGLFGAVLDHVSAGRLRSAVERASALPVGESVHTAAALLGNGTEVLAFDTVPLGLWVVARHGGDYEAPLWASVSALGDRDTACAIVGGILTASPSTPQSSPHLVLLKSHRTPLQRRHALAQLRQKPS